MSDSRLEDIEQEIAKHLNDDATLAKVRIATNNYRVLQRRVDRVV